MIPLSMSSLGWRWGPRSLDIIRGCVGTCVCSCVNVVGRALLGVVESRCKMYGTKIRFGNLFWLHESRRKAETYSISHITLIVSHKESIQKKQWRNLAGKYNQKNHYSSIWTQSFLTNALSTSHFQLWNEPNSTIHDNSTSRELRLVLTLLCEEGS